MRTTSAPVAVLGMHRSGTSCLAGTLVECGVKFCDVSQWNPHNLKGNYENPAIMRLHDDLLCSNGGAWYDPPTEVQWDRPHRDRRDRIIDAYERSAGDNWGFKDPRTVLTLSGWRDAVPNLFLVGVFRHPDCVVQSLVRRQPLTFSERSGLELWCEYNRRLLAHALEFRFPIIEFDSDAAVWLDELDRLIRHLGLQKPDAGFGFFESLLRNVEPRAGTAVSVESQRIYEALCDYSQRGPAAHSQYTIKHRPAA